mmetsp:Transcript_38956/g.111139  ORF Transcript_38956/g.111139 Transcript_38956/m.111139 type:complete len:638 (+) Transcript_38956:91-2004(+)
MMDPGPSCMDPGLPEQDPSCGDGGNGAPTSQGQESTDSKSGAVEVRSTGGGTGIRAAGTRKPKRLAAPPPPLPPDRRPRKQRKEAGPPAADAAGGAASGPGASDGVPQRVSAGAAASPVLGPHKGYPPPGLSTMDEDVVGDERAREVQRLQSELGIVREQYMQQKRRLNAMVADRAVTKKVLSGLLVQIARIEDAEEREEVASARYHLGFCRQMTLLDARRGQWEGGYEADELVRLKDRIREDRLCIQRLRGQLTRQGRARANAGGAGTAKDGEDAAGSGDEADDLWEGREISSCRMTFLAREELAVKEREQRLEVNRALHLKQVHRLEAAEHSNFRTYPLLADNRYQLLNMIGRGGFSEVFRAYDLENNRYCAVKIHELGKDMSDQQRQSYIRRAMREYEIQKTLNHPRVVTLQDCFPISTRAFGTVLQLCEGETLDEHMRRHGALPEREARGIVIQVLSGLRYMNTNGRKIIHYDLKPGNLFFHCGEVKIADFGLSKVVHESFGESIDLTSQGAGTYWYLPPECFVDAGQQEPPKISNKVDVWSTGVIFFELLFKRRPFGHGQSQEALLRRCMAASQPFTLEIPLMPKASSDAKDFLKRVLTVNREERPDVIEAYSDPYLRSRWRMSSSGAGTVS